MVQLVKHWPLAQVMIPGSWDQAPSQGSPFNRVSASPSPSALPLTYAFSLAHTHSSKEVKS